MPIVYWLLDQNGELTGDCTLYPEKGMTYFVGSVLKYGGMSHRVNGIVITFGGSGEDIRSDTDRKREENREPVRPDGRDEQKNRDRVVKK
jgi:5'-3' exonuclease